MTFSPRLARIVRRTLLTFAVLATVLLVAVLIENWRGDRAWAAYAAKAKAAGAQLDSFPAPSDLPPARNFMKTPVLDRWLWVKGDNLERNQLVNDLGAPIGGWNQMWKQGRRFDPALVTHAHPEPSDGRTPAVPSAAVIDAVLEELRQAALERAGSELQRPKAISMESSHPAPIPSFGIARVLSMTLGINACEALADGRSDVAHADVVAGLKLARGFARTPDCLLVEAMIGVVLADAALHPVWEGLDRQSWTDEQLQQLQVELEAIDVMASLERGLESERTAFVAISNHVPPGRLLFDAGEFLGEETPAIVRRMMKIPRGWVQQNKIVACEAIAPAFEFLGACGTARFLSLREHARDLGIRTTPYNFLGLMMVPGFGKVSDNATRGATYLELAQAACALERYRLAHAELPEALSQLVPTFLDRVPRDLVDGQPLRYRRRAEGGIDLYSVALDGKDDGGTPIESEALGATPVGDWCWPRAASAAP